MKKVIPVRNSSYKPPTERQKRAVAFCEEWLNIEYKGSLEDRSEISKFLDKNLDNAKAVALDAASSFWSMESGY